MTGAKISNSWAGFGSNQMVTDYSIPSEILNVSTALLAIFQGKEATSKSVAGEGLSSSTSVKTGSVSGRGDSTSSSTAKKTSAATTTSGRDLSKVELIAELNCRLAKLTDTAATEVNVQRRSTATTKTTADPNPDLRPPSSRAAHCSKDSISRAQSVPKTTTKSGERNGATSTKQRTSSSATAAGITSATNNGNKSSTPLQQTQVTTAIRALLHYNRHR